MSGFTRRELLRLLSIIAPTLLLATMKERDYLAEELVCVHIYDPRGAIPEPLLARHEEISQRSEGENHFQIGLPELIVCATRVKLLEVFGYFWPVSRQEMRELKNSIAVRFQRQTVGGRKEVDELIEFMQKGNSLRPPGHSLALILTLNDHTTYWTADLIEACRAGGIEELVIFKDPSRSPYLCSYPSLQRGFKRPPPIG